MADPYASERYNPTLAHCGMLTLLFDGKTLKLSGGSKTYTYTACSGKPAADGSFDYSQERQKKQGEGPIPEGIYWIRPDELKSLWYYFGKAYAGWGSYRITIHPFTTTETFGRGGFFIHGGTVAGSAGCIDLVGQIDAFAADLIKEVGEKTECQIHLTVRY